MTILEALSGALLIFVLRISDVSMGTVRTIMILRGMRKWAAFIGFFEVTIWVLAISRVIGNLDTVWNVIGYSGGFAAGTLLGMWIEDKLAFGYVNVRVISRCKGMEIACKVRQEGYGATQFQAEGQSGPLHLVGVVAARKQVPDILRVVKEVDSAAFITVEETRQIFGGYQRLAK